MITVLDTVRGSGYEGTDRLLTCRNARHGTVGKWGLCFSFRWDTRLSKALGAEMLPRAFCH